MKTNLEQTIHTPEETTEDWMGDVRIQLENYIDAHPKAEDLWREQVRAMDYDELKAALLDMDGAISAFMSDSLSDALFEIDGAMVSSLEREAMLRSVHATFKGDES
jgi:ribonucleotide reductase alpha subunit